MNERSHRTHWCSHALETRWCGPAKGWGVFATTKIAANEILTVWGGDIVSHSTFLGLDPSIRRRGLQVDISHFLVALDGELEDADLVNHSCNPNAGMRGQVSLVAMRDIEPGEEVTFDYAMTDSLPYDEFSCSCGAEDCRGEIRASDWKLETLQARYRGFFSSYLQHQICHLHDGSTVGPV